MLFYFLMLLLLKGNLGHYYLLTFRKGWSSVSSAKGCMKGSKGGTFPWHLEHSNSSYYGGHLGSSGSFHSVNTFLKHKWTIQMQPAFHPYR